MPQTKSYLVELYAEKSITGWNNEEGAHGPTRIVDTWKETVTSDQKPVAGTGRTLLFEFLSRYGVSPHSFRYWPNEPGRFTANRIENNDGRESQHGSWLADYDVRIEIREIGPVFHPKDHLGLKSVDE